MFELLFSVVFSSTDRPYSPPAPAKQGGRRGEESSRETGAEDAPET